jgi:phytoene dehydrogenase-like protein
VSWSAKLQGASLFARVGAFDTAALASVTWEEFAGGRLSHPVMRAAIDALVRVTTYVDAPSLASAGAILDQLRLTQHGGVLYLDGGWQSLVDACEQAAQAAGVQLTAGATVTAAARDDDGWRVSIEGEEPMGCRAVVLATGPAAARSLVASDHDRGRAPGTAPGRGPRCSRRVRRRRLGRRRGHAARCLARERCARCRGARRDLQERHGKSGLTARP